jgi:hypothetical protein
MAIAGNFGELITRGLTSNLDVFFSCFDDYYKNQIYPSFNNEDFYHVI